MSFFPHPPTWAAVRAWPAPLRIAGFLLFCLGFALPVAGPCLWLSYWDPDGPWSIGTMVALGGSFLVWVGPWMGRVHGVRQVWRALGWRGPWGREWGLGVAVGCGGVLTLFGAQVLLGWGAWQGWPEAILRVVLLGALMATAVGWGEELLFRGWLLAELERDYAPAIALVGNSLIFAMAHYIRPWEVILATWPQFFGLLLLGITLVWARRSPAGRETQGTLGLAAGLHSGLVWAYYLVQVGDLVRPTGQVPSWVTGIDGNPLAGMMGVLLLGAIAAGLYRRSRAPSPSARGFSTMGSRRFPPFR